MSVLFDLHQLITRTSRSYSLVRVSFSNDAQDGRSYLQTIATSVGIRRVVWIWGPVYGKRNGSPGIRVRERGWW